MKSKSQAVTKPKAAKATAPASKILSHRLPRNRPPTAPGEMLLEEFLKPLRITQTDFASRLGISFPRLNEIIHGKRAITPDTGLRLARVLGTSAEFWLGLQLDWDLWHAMQGRQAAEIRRLKPLARPRGENSPLFTERFR